MTYLTNLASPLGPLTLASNGEALTGLWLENQKYFAAGMEPEAENRPDLLVFRQAEAWLELYFSGQNPCETPVLAPQGSAFRQVVWKELLEIPYGQTCTYGELAKKLGSSPRAVGGAVGHNPISIFIPCHRVLGNGGRLTGYAGGIEKKRFLLELEKTGLTGREKQMLALFSERASSVQKETAFESGKFPCPCCGNKTFPVPMEEAVAYICPVCFWENDVFSPGANQPSDENHGMTLMEGRRAYREFGAVREDFLPHIRKPLPDEIP